MTVLVTDDGFRADSWNGPIVPLADDDGTVRALDVPSDTDPASLKDRIDTLGLIRVDFPSFSDGRGFTIARQLRLLGFQGRLRAHGHVIADQYAMARRCGFDEVEIADDLAERQPEDQWLARANWQAHNYQARLRG
ncbi:Uncharacterized conserved protein, DUF934 family [Poseidonocella pacifica]|uniref:Uncharacterized conserved protein, DUF934 family n=1 Tax=Poseidonocella pacifica TaxID=871651 RepID=A0A1I0XCZ1_9RHOB|nr:DUF934 domain-containing protein [Poseidonocella pacifica]SFA98861.1 Uncharacterized conserved protein, DUF934 family [Poseidonocella pacifica]